MAAGALSGATTLLFTYPTDLARTRISHDHTYKGVRDVLGRIRNSDGFRGFYRGFATSMFGVMLYRSIYFGGYDSAKHVAFEDYTKATFAEAF